MPRIQTTVQFSMDPDGVPATSHKGIVDLSASLSSYYGKLVRQGQYFTVRNVQFRLKNPNTLVQDEMMAASGTVLWYGPTGPRTAAWKNAFTACQGLRRDMGQTSAFYDFRVGLHDSFPEVINQAWINAEGEPLFLSAPNMTPQGCYQVANESLQPAQPNVNPAGGFGTPYISGTEDSTFDFIDNEQVYFQPGGANTTPDRSPFMLSFSTHDNPASQDNAVTPISETGYIGQVQCGLLGVEIDTVGIDDGAVTHDTTVEVTVDVVSWRPMMGAKRASKAKKSRRRSK